MNVLPLFWKYCPGRNPYKLGQRLGSGVDGEVFEIARSNRVVKFCILHESDKGNVHELYLKTIDPILTSLVSRAVNVFARVYTYEYVGVFSKNENRFALYFYTMEKLEDISDDEKKVFHTIISHEDRNIVKDFSINEVQEKLKGLSLGLSFDEKKVIFFYENLKKSYINHNDIHVRNIMKDNQGNFKMIDFDRTQVHGE